jgi:zinc protease
MRVLCLSLIIASVVFLANAKDVKEFKIPYEMYKLSNGMTVLLRLDKSNPIAAVYVAYHVGSAREEKGRTGFAHLFEHLRFNESQDIPQGMWFKKLQTVGASNVNGSTNNDRTNYFEVIPKNAVELALWMESDRMGFLLSKFTQATFTTQQNVVQNEKRQSDNNPYSQSSYIMDKLMYPENHPYNWQVIGSLEDLSNASIQDAINFHNKYYGPSNATLVVAGDIDVPQVKQWIEKYFAEISSSPAPAPLPKMPVVLKESKRALYEDNLANAPQLSIAFPTVEEYNKDAYALNFLARILGGTKKSPLYKVLVEEKKLAPAGIGGGGFGRGGGGGASVTVSQSGGEIAGTFQVTVRAFPEVKLSDVEAAIYEAFARFEKEGFTDKDVERQKAGLEFRFYNSVSSLLGKAMRLSDYLIFAGSPDFMATDLQNSMNVTKEDIWRVYNKFIKGKNFVLTSIVPKGKAELAAANSTPFLVSEESIDKQGLKRENMGDYKPQPIPSKIDRTKDPVPGEDPSVQLPSIWTGKTANGIPVYGIVYNELPIAQFSIILKGGMMLDPPDKVGTAYLTARLMNEGTKSKTPIELREAIEDLGANISISANEEATTLTGSCLASKLNETMALAKEMLLEPRWDEKEFGLAKTQTIEQLKRSERQPTTISSRVFDKLVYGQGCILSNSVMGTQNSVQTITLDDLKAYYATAYSPTVVKVIVLGDISKEKAMQLIEALSIWKGEIVKFPDVKIASSAKPGVYFVDVPNARQSVVSAGHLGLRYNDPDYYKTIVMNQKLGGDFSGILNMILREAKSFTYGARSSFSGSENPGTFKATTQVQSNATFETCQIIKDEVAKYRNGISEEDLNQVKSVLTKSNAGRFETLQQLGAMLLPIVLYGVPDDYVRRNETTVKNMTTQEEKAIAQKYLKPDAMVFLVVGDRETQFAKLKELGLGDPILIDKDANPVLK